jgi:hypothetical protein
MNTIAEQQDVAVDDRVPSDDEDLGEALRGFQRACDHVWNTVRVIANDSSAPKIERALLVEVDRARREVTMQFAALRKTVRTLVASEADHG